MSALRLRPILTVARRDWLEALEADPATPRPGTVAGYACLRLGWVECLIRVNGETMSDSEFERRFPRYTDQRSAALDAPDWAVVGHVLTSAGRAMLALARAEDVAP